MRTQFTVIGIPDDPNYISNNKTIVDIINNNTYFSGGKRHHEIVMPFLPPDAIWIDIKVPLDNVFDEYEYHQKIVVFASGDPLFYGFASTILKRMPEAEITLLPSFNSLQMLSHELKVSYEDMTMVSLTVVASFQAVGAILVIGLMIGPAAIAYLWTDSVKAMLISSIIIGIICAVIGTEVAFTLDVSIAGAIATTIGLALLIAVIGTPKTGYIATYLRQRHLRRHYRETMMLCHIYTHMNTPVAAIENGIGTIHEHLNWKPDYTHQAASHLKKQGLLYVTNGYYMLTDKGVAQVKEII